MESMPKYNQIINKALQTAHDVKGNLGFKQEKKGKYFTISSKQYKDNQFKLVKIEGVIPASLEKVQKYYFENRESQAKNSDMCDGIITIEGIDKDTEVILYKLRSKAIVSARENLSVIHRRYLSEREFVIVSGHLDEHPNVPFKKDVVRSEMKVYAQFLNVIDQNNTKVEIYFLNDPKGSIPSFFMNSLIDSFLVNFEKDYLSLLATV